MSTSLQAIAEIPYPNGTKVYHPEYEMMGIIQQVQLFPVSRHRDFFTYYVRWENGRLGSVKADRLIKINNE